MTPEDVENRARVDAAIARSSSKAELVGHLERLGQDDTAQALVGKALIASKSPWGVLVAYALGLLLTKYGLHASDETMAFVTGLFVLSGGFVMRLITKAPITGILKPKDI